MYASEYTQENIRYDTGPRTCMCFGMGVCVWIVRYILTLRLCIPMYFQFEVGYTKINHCKHQHINIFQIKCAPLYSMGLRFLLLDFCFFFRMQSTLENPKQNKCLWQIFICIDEISLWIRYSLFSSNWKQTNILFGS